MNYHSDKWIMAGVQRHYNELIKHYSPDSVIALLYQGSANYKADYENSDIDTWAVIASEELIMTQLSVNNNTEVIWITDIVSYLRGLIMSDWQYLTTIYTAYKIINPHFQDLWEQIQQKASSFAVNAQNNLYNTTKKIIIDETTKMLYDARKPYSKRLYLVLTQFFVLALMEKQEPFETLFQEDEYRTEMLKNAKRGKFSKDEALNMAYACIHAINKIHPPKDTHDPELEDFTNQLAIQIMRRYKEVLNGCPNENWG